MENKVLDKNLAHIKQYNKGLYNKVLMTDIEKSNLQLSTTQSGEYNLVFNGIELHSPNGAAIEAEKITDNFKDKAENLIIVYGLALGYLPDTISKRCPKSTVVIYEPNMEIIKLVLQIAKIDALYQNNVFLVSDKQEFSDILKENSSEDTNLSITFLNSYKNLFYDDILSIFQYAQNVISESVGNKNTYIKKMPFASCNTFRNLKEILKSPLIDELKDVYKGKTALIMCAGPSLSDNIEIIKQNQDKFVTFALNPTLQLLKKHSITPDFVVDIDVINNSRQFENVDLLNSYFITDAYTFHDIAVLPSKKHFFYISEGNFYNYWVKRALKINNNFKSLGTSSYTAFQAAILMGFSKIVFIGQDLAYKDKRCYAKGSQFEMIECVFNEEKQKFEISVPDFEAFKAAFRLKTMDDEYATQRAKAFLNITNSNLRTTKDKNGNLIPTKADYLVFIKLFEDCAKDIKDIELINASDGADIKGYKNISLEEVLKDAKEIEKIDLTNYSTKYDMDNFKKEAAILENNLKKSHEAMNDFIEISKKLLKEIETKKTVTDNILKTLEKCNNSFKNLVNQYENEDINNLLSVFGYRINEVLSSDNLSDEKVLMETFRKLIPMCEDMSVLMNRYISYLHNSQTLVL